MRDWKHQVSREWLKARQDVLTATEARDLLAASKKFNAVKKPSIWTAPEFLGVIAKKESLNEPDVNSPSPDAARGHILEPYAVKEFNAYAKAHGYNWPEMYPWDDCLIRDHKDSIAFSPDAMNVVQPNKDIVWHYKNNYITSESDNIEAPTAILEIKSYNSTNHMKCGFTRKTGLKERYQLAYAMLVCPSVEDAYLMFYNPDSAQYSVFIKHYTRAELEKEMDLMYTVYQNYIWYMNELNGSQGFKYTSQYTEEQIWNEYIKEHERDVLNKEV